MLPFWDRIWGWLGQGLTIYIVLTGSELTKSQTGNPLAYVPGTGITGMCHYSKYMNSASNTNNFDKSKVDKKKSQIYTFLLLINFKGLPLD